jgi:cytosine deaminase
MLGCGHNRRVQQNSMVRHAEIDCLEAAGRRSTFAATTLYSTLMPCYMCAGAVVQFKIPRVVVGDSRTFPGGADLLQAHGVEIVDLASEECVALLRRFVAENPSIWDEDTGASAG